MALDEIQNLLKEFDEMKRSLGKTESELQKKSVELESINKAFQVRLIDLENTKKAVLNLLDDVSEEKRVSEKRAEELQKFQLAVENTSQHVIITDASGVVIYANSAVEKLTGYSHEEIIGNKPSLWGKQMPKEFYADMWRTIKEERKTFTGELQNRKKNGEIYTASALISPVINTKGELKFFVGIETDITKSKEFEQTLISEKERVDKEVKGKTKALREEQARLLASINSLSFGFVIADLNDNVIVKNAALLTILELTEEPVSVKNIIDSFKGVASGLDVLTHSCRECIDLKKVVELKEIPHGKKYLRVFCTPIITKDETSQDMQEKVIGYAMLVEDVTEVKIMERSRDEFFAVASHELRTPLTAIRGNADMILETYKDKIVDKDMKEMLQDINTSSIRLINIVNDFLEVSRLEQGKIEIKKENFNVSDVVEKVVRDLKTMDEQKGLSLVYTIPPSPLPTVFADRQRTEQILINLVGNAAKFTKEGGITITASVAGSFVGIRVIDTGLGISEHNQALLFRKFQQAGEQMLARDVTQSTGLGLYISKLIISSMGGTIGIEKSELGKGSTFMFTLPISE